MTLPVAHHEFLRSRLHESELPDDPLIQFQKWVDEAIAASVRDWESFTLATATRTGVPSARTLFLRGADERGFVFFTNYESRKGQQLAENPQAALTLHWRELERQICMEGAVEQVSAAESDAYFAGRPLQSQLGAWASQQSRPLASAEELRDRVEQLRAKFDGGPIPRPPHWGGYRLVPAADAVGAGAWDLRGMEHDAVSVVTGGPQW